MPPPTNIDGLTAIDLGSLPASVTQDVRDSGTNYTVWYKYTTSATEVTIGVFGFGALSPGYRPTIHVFDGPAAAPTVYPHDGSQIVATNVPVQIPVTPLTTYFFEFVSSTGNTPTTAILTLTAYTAPTTSFSLGDIFINDDTRHLPAIILNGSTGAPKKFINPFPAGEGGDVLTSGVILVDDNSAANLQLYNADLTLNTTITTFVWVGTDCRIRTCNGANKFYVGSEGAGATHALANTISSTGVLGSTIGPFAAAGLTAIAAKNDESILYYVQTVGGAVKRWNIPGNIATTDLVAGIASYAVFDILYLDDDTIIVGYYKSSATRDLKVIQYDTSGSVLNTYNFGSTNDNGPRLSYAIDNPNSFWIWTHVASVSTLTNIKCSDGSTITTFSLTEYEGGAYQGAQTATPLNNFGPSFSCPFFILRVSEAVPGSITVIKATNPTGSSQDFSFTTDGLDPFIFTLSDGESQVFSGLLEGTYGVTEDAILNWITAYNVSSGDPHDAIVIGAGDDVTVTVTNTLIASTKSGIYKIVPGKRNDTLWLAGFTGTEDVKIP